MVYIAFVVGICVGAFITNLVMDARSGFGTLRIDHSNPEKDVYLFDIDKFEDISGKKRVILRVDHNANLSQN